MLPERVNFLTFRRSKSIIKENTHNASDVTKLRMTDFQKRHKIEETKKIDEHEMEEITILKGAAKVRAITINYILR